MSASTHFPCKPRLDDPINIHLRIILMPLRPVACNSCLFIVPRVVYVWCYTGVLCCTCRFVWNYTGDEYIRACARESIDRIRVSLRLPRAILMASSGIKVASLLYRLPRVRLNNIADLPGAKKKVSDAISGVGSTRNGNRPHVTYCLEYRSVIIKNNKEYWK